MLIGRSLKQPEGVQLYDVSTALMLQTAKCVMVLSVTIKAPDVETWSYPVSWPR